MKNKNRIRRIETAALTVLPTLYEGVWKIMQSEEAESLSSEVREQLLLESEEKIIESAVLVGRQFADAMEKEESEDVDE